MTTLQAVRNSIHRGLARALPLGWWGGSPKHNHPKDFGWPEALDFEHFKRMYERNGLATAAVDKTAAKTWETHPLLWESEEPAESPLEEDIRRRFEILRLWQAMMNVDRRSMVGRYSAAIILLADSLPLDQPVTRVPGELDGLAGIIPVWENQLTVAEWDDDISSSTYGRPSMYQYDEVALGENGGQNRQIKIHPDRILIWSEDGTIHGRSMLEPGYNDLLDAEKVKGAGGEGFWKTARASPMIEAPDGMSMADVMKGMGADTPEDAMDVMNEQVESFNSGFDKLLMLGGLTAKPLNITLPQPKEFFDIPVKSFAASVQMPVRVLIGNETGERASTEDAREWAQVNMSRRVNLCVPVLREFVGRLVAWGILPARDWTIGWADLTEATAGEKLDRAYRMSEINSKAVAGDEPPFLPNEIREAAGYDTIPGLDDVVEPDGAQPVEPEDMETSE